MVRSACLRFHPVRRDMAEKQKICRTMTQPDAGGDEDEKREEDGRGRSEGKLAGRPEKATNSGEKEEKIVNRVERNLHKH